MYKFNTTVTANMLNDDSSLARCYHDMTYVVKTPSRSYIINSVFACTANAVFSILGTFLNALVIWIFSKTRKLREKTCYFMIMVLSSVDLSVTAVVQPLYLLNSVAEITAAPKCSYKMTSQIASVCLSGMSTMTFFTLNIERYLSIVHSVFHRNHITKQKCLMFLGVLWLVCIVVAVGPLFELTIDIVVTLLAILICIGTFYMYIAIFYVARQRVHSITRNTVNEISIAGAAEPETGQQQPDSPRNIETTSQDFLLAKTCLIVVVSSFICHLPNAIVLSAWRERLDTINFAVQVRVWTTSLVAMNSTFNCLIFFWANKTLEHEGWKVLKQCFGGNVAPEE